MQRCQWPRDKADVCTNRARVKVRHTKRGLERWVCGIHDRSARRMHWERVPISKR
jgi:hypothetical protein